MFLLQRTHAAGLRIDAKKGLIPRIMVGARNGVENVKLVVVGKNPGRPDSEEEQERYANAIKGVERFRWPEELVGAMISWGEERHLNPK
jgi:hypothetical protein